MSKLTDKIEKSLTKATAKLGIEESKGNKIEFTNDFAFGDFTSNIAFIHAKAQKTNPKDLASKIVEEIKKDLPEEVQKVETQGGFINFHIKNTYFTKEILDIGADFGKNLHDDGKKVIIEYTDPNPFKIFHVGHLMANAIGESISRVVEYSSADVVRACYQGDVGLHVAKTIWAIMRSDVPKKAGQDGAADLVSQVEFLGKMYVIGSEKYEADAVAKKEIDEVNKKIFEKSDKKINDIYDEGRKLSLEYFDLIYQKLGTKFDVFFFESDMAKAGIRIVGEYLLKGVFEESEGAIVFKGEKYGTHTRVFISSKGLPTYETKELGLTEVKFEMFPDLSESIVVTANEQNDYFKVILAALQAVNPLMGSKTKHISHGLLRPSSGKMSSRKGNIVPAELLIEEFENLVSDKIKDRGFDKKEQQDVCSSVAIAAIKYVILRQAIGGDIIYEPTNAVSFEGDSGPYLQYACVRAKSVVKKAVAEQISDIVTTLPAEVHLLEKLVLRFPNVVERARIEYSPHYIVTYLTELAAAFNSYYSMHQIIDVKDPLSPYRVKITKTFAQIMEKGLWLLGIEVPKRM